MAAVDSCCSGGSGIDAGRKRLLTPSGKERKTKLPLFRLFVGLVIVGGIFAVVAALILGVVFGLSHFLRIGGTEWVGLLNIVGVAIILVMLTGTLLIVAERKWSARMQNRVGPSRARLHKSIKNPLWGIPHLAADGLKMIFKEDFVPPHGSKFFFNLAPILVFTPVFALIAVVPVGPDLVAFGTEVRFQVARLDMGILYIFAIASLAVFGTALAGWSSNNNFGMMGALRAAAQMISYEVALALTLVGAFIIYQTLRLESMVGFQDMTMWGGLVPAWGIFFQPFAFVFFLAAAFAEVKRAPFDQPEAESEIVGYFVEYSGMKFGLFMFAEFIEIVALAALITVLFFGGWSIPWVPYVTLQGWLANTAGMGADWGAILAAYLCILSFVIKMMFFVWLQMLIRWSFPRFRYDQVMGLGWKGLLPLSILNVIITSVAVVIDPTLNLALAIGLVQFVILAGVIITAAAPQREDVRAMMDANDTDHEERDMQDKPSTALASL